MPVEQQMNAARLQGARFPVRAAVCCVSRLRIPSYYVFDDTARTRFGLVLVLVRAPDDSATFA